MTRVFSVGKSKHQDKGDKNDSISVSILHWLDIWHFIRLRKQVDHDSKHIVTSNKDGKGNTFFRMLLRLIANRNLKTLVAKENGHMVGYVSLLFPKFKKLKGNVYLTISVKGTHRGKGLGTHLMNVAEKFAMKQGVRRIELEVFSKNKALDLYKRLGYEEEGRRRKAVESDGEFDDVVFMAKFVK